MELREYQEVIKEHQEKLVKVDLSVVDEKFVIDEKVFLLSILSRLYMLRIEKKKEYLRAKTQRALVEKLNYEKVKNSEAKVTIKDAETKAFLASEDVIREELDSLVELVEIEGLIEAIKALIDGYQAYIWVFKEEKKMVEEGV